MQPIGGIMIFILQLAIVAQSWKIEFRCYTQKDDPAVQKFTVDHEKKLDDFKNFNDSFKKGFHRNASTIILIHGFKANADSWPETAKNKLLGEIPGVNVITVDWRKGAEMSFLKLWRAFNYPRAAKNTHPVGKQIARFINSLVNQGYIDNVNNVHLVGHSLGAQAAGYACMEYTEEYFSQAETEKAEKKQENGIIGRLTGLDPAEPHFETTVYNWLQKRSLGRRGNQNVIQFLSWVIGLKRKYPKCFSPIYKDAARFVDIIHTSSLGMKFSVGHADFYPNGGHKMPSCDHVNGLAKRKNLCNHSMAHKYWVESIADLKQFSAYSCTNYEHFKQDCNTTDAMTQNIMGYHSKKIQTQSFYLDTTSTPPYWEVCPPNTGRNNSETLQQFGNQNPNQKSEYDSECPAEFDYS